MNKTSIGLLFGALALFGCGHTEEEWQAQLDKYGRLQNESTAKDQKIAHTQQELDEAKARVSDLTKQLESMGVDLQETKGKVGALASTLEERERALNDYKARARQLEAIKARFDLLRKKLDELTKLGLAVNIRRNRMVISLPGDVLFDSGRETLKKEGKAILDKVAAVIKADPSLSQRDYQVSGHTDNKPLQGGQFKDNWGLSLMRAREVLVHLVSDKGGSLSTQHWSASGFADTDPISSNDADDGRQKNRRCELVVVPSVEEMLDLKTIAN
jgi:chemotaxis protein MotB